MSEEHKFPWFAVGVTTTVLGFIIGMSITSVGFKHNPADKKQALSTPCKAEQVMAMTTSAGVWTCVDPPSFHTNVTSGGMPMTGNITTSGKITNIAVGETMQDSPACHCDPHALDFAVMQRLEEAGVHTDYNSAYEGPVEPLNQEKKYRVKLRAIASKIQDSCLRKAYLHWLSVYDDDLVNAYAAIEKGGQSEIERRAAELRRQFAEAERCKRDGTVPVLRNQ